MRGCPPDPHITVVDIRVTAGRRRPGLGQRIAVSVLGRPRIAAGLAAAAAVLTITDVVSQAGQIGRPQSANPAMAHRRGPVGVAAAYRIPGSLRERHDRQRRSCLCPSGLQSGEPMRTLRRRRDRHLQPHRGRVAARAGRRQLLLPDGLASRGRAEPARRCPQLPRVTTRRAARRSDR